MKVIVLALIAMLCFPGVILAVPNNVVTGPYKVSFDMGLNHGDYNITTPEPFAADVLDESEGTDYEIIIHNINKTKLNESGINKTIVSQTPISGPANGTFDGMYFAEIHINESKRAQYLPDADGIVKFLKKHNENDRHVSAIKVGTRTIDGASGAVAFMQWSPDPDIYTPIESYDCIYFANFDPSHVMVEIKSHYPWDNGTLRLLKTVHVEKKH